MTVLQFSKLSSREKWHKIKELKNIIIVCNKCGSIIDDNSIPPYSAIFPGEIRECGYCGNELTYRTGGGQSDPFNYDIFKCKTNYNNMTCKQKEKLQNKLHKHFEKKFLRKEEIEEKLEYYRLKRKYEKG